MMVTYCLLKHAVHLSGKEKKDSWALLHIHASHARDIPLEFDSAYQTPDINEYASWFQYLREVDFNDTKNERIQFRDLDSTTHYLLPSEIIYIQSNDKNLYYLYFW